MAELIRVLFRTRGMNEDASRRAAVAERAARSGAAVAAARFRDGIPIETKDGKTDVVTEADRAAQREVVDVVAETYPDDTIVGEEDDVTKAVPETGSAWVIDPIDGTNNFVRDISVWATSVAAVRDGEPVAAANVLPELDDVYVAGPDEATRNGEPITVSERTDPDTCTVAPTIWWGFDRREEYARAVTEVVEQFGDLRRFGCAQATLSMVASGALDATITNVETNPWDTIAGVHLVERAGGTVTDLDGEPWRHDSVGLVASNGEVHDEVLAAARAIDGR